MVVSKDHMYQNRDRSDWMIGFNYSNFTIYLGVDPNATLS